LAAVILQKSWYFQVLMSWGVKNPLVTAARRAGSAARIGDWSDRKHRCSTEPTEADFRRVPHRAGAAL
jgi:hypothetical protein